MDINKFKNDIKNENLIIAQNYLNTVFTHLKTYYKSFENVDKNEFLESLENNFVDTANSYYTIIDRLSGSHVQSFISDYLLKNENILKQEYQKLKNKNIEDNNNTYYTYNKKKSSRLLIRNILLIIRQQLKEQNVKISEEDEYQYLKNSLLNIKNILPSSQKEDNIKLLEIAKDFFDDYNILNKLNNKHSSQLNSLWLEDLSFNMNPCENFENDIGINSLLSRKNLEKLPLEQLSVLNIFWQNKYSKELSDINMGYFIFQQLDLYDKLSEDNLKVDNNTLYNLLIKYKVLESISCRIYDIKQNNLSSTNFIKDLSDNYQKYFSKHLPNLENNLEKDLEQCINRILASKNIYGIKSNLICSTIANLADNKKLKNWGYINDNEENSPNSIIAQNPYILIGIDYPGLNRPVKTHIQTSLLQKTLVDMLDTNLIPVYEGNSDYINNYSHLPTHIVLPFEKRHKAFLRKQTNIEKSDFKYPIIAHSIFLANPDKFPEHLKKNINGKKTRVRTYIDLFSGIIYGDDKKTPFPCDSDSKEER